jgi:hypothetical protein
MSARPEGFEDLLQTMKTAAGALRGADVEFMLGGGLAVWARGGPTTDHDIDFLIRPRDARAAQDALVAAGFRPETVPEEWLLKVWDGDVLVDLIFCPAGGPVGDDEFARAEELEVMAVRMPVASAGDVLATKLLAITEQHPDFKSTLELARALREQIDWDAVRAKAGASPFAQAFFTLVDELGIAEAPAAPPRRLSSVKREAVSAVRKAACRKSLIASATKTDSTARVGRGIQIVPSTKVAHTHWPVHFGHVSSWPTARRMPVPVASSTSSPSPSSTVAVNGARSGEATLSFAISRETLWAATPASAMSTSDGRRCSRPVAFASRMPPPKIAEKAPISVV